MKGGGKGRDRDFHLRYNYTLCEFPSMNMYYMYEFLQNQLKPNNIKLTSAAVIPGPTENNIGSLECDLHICVQKRKNQDHLFFRFPT